MPRILVTEAEKAELLKQREVRALQALAWNEALTVAVVKIQDCLPQNADTNRCINSILEQRRPTNGLT